MVSCFVMRWLSLIGVLISVTNAHVMTVEDLNDLKLHFKPQPEDVDVERNYRLFVNRSQETINSTLTTDGHYREIVVTLQAFGETFLLDLKLNMYLFATTYIEKSISSIGETYHTVNHTRDHCHYLGNVRNRTHSLAAVSTCNGIVGYFTIGNLTYHIDPQSDNINGLHGIYRNKEGTKKKYSCGTHGGERRFLPRDVYQRRSRVRRDFLWPQDLDKVNKVVELYVANSYDQYQSYFGGIFDRTKTIVNIASALYQPLGIYLVMVGVEAWTTGNLITINSNDSMVTLFNFYAYRRTNINPLHYNDNAALISSIIFPGGVIGKALETSMCSFNSSGEIITDFQTLPAQAGSTLAHEIGHTFGLIHDQDSCPCDDPDGGHCIMYYQTDASDPATHWSQCSKDQLTAAFQHGMDICLYDLPLTIYQSDLSTCGNGIVESGEQCDCGKATSLVCNPLCCDSRTCQLIGFAACAAGRCCNVATCQIQSQSTVCRPSTGECDVAELCDGSNSRCPTDTFRPDGTSCTQLQAAYCYQGQCRSPLSQCQLLWGLATSVSNDYCLIFSNTRGDLYGNCGMNWLNNPPGIPCTPSNVQCGRLQCSVTTPVLSHYLNFFTLAASAIGPYPCQAAIFDYGMRIVDPGLVPNGAKCGDGKMCINQVCRNVSDVLQPSCFPSCLPNEVCNNLNQCQLISPTPSSSTSSTTTTTSTSTTSTTTTPTTTTPTTTTSTTTTPSTITSTTTTPTTTTSTTTTSTITIPTTTLPTTTTPTTTTPTTTTSTTTTPTTSTSTTTTSTTTTPSTITSTTTTPTTTTSTTTTPTTSTPTTSIPTTTTSTTTTPSTITSTTTTSTTSTPTTTTSTTTTPTTTTLTTLPTTTTSTTSITTTFTTTLPTTTTSTTSTASTPTTTTSTTTTPTTITSTMTSSTTTTPTTTTSTTTTPTTVTSTTTSSTTTTPTTTTLTTIPTTTSTTTTTASTPTTTTFTTTLPTTTTSTTTTPTTTSTTTTSTTATPTASTSTTTSTLPTPSSSSTTTTSTISTTAEPGPGEGAFGLYLGSSVAGVIAPLPLDGSIANRFSRYNFSSYTFQSRLTVDQQFLYTEICAGLYGPRTAQLKTFGAFPTIGYDWLSTAQNGVDSGCRGGVLSANNIVTLSLNQTGNAVYASKDQRETSWSLFSVTDTMKYDSQLLCIYSAGSSSVYGPLPFLSPFVNPTSPALLYNAATTAYTCGSSAAAYFVSMSVGVPAGKTATVQLVISGFRYTFEMSRQNTRTTNTTTLARTVLVPCTTDARLVLSSGEVVPGTNLISFTAFPYELKTGTSVAWAGYRTVDVTSPGMLTYDLWLVLENTFFQVQNSVVQIPISGYYYVYISGGVPQGKTLVFTVLVNNTPLLGLTRMATDHNGIDTIGHGMVVLLSANDLIKVFAATTAISSSTGLHTSFIGLLLYTV